MGVGCSCSGWLLVGEELFCIGGTLRGMTDELEALQWLTADELAAARRRAIWRLNLLDRSSVDYSAAATMLERTMALIGQVQEGRRRNR